MVTLMDTPLKVSLVLVPMVIMVGQFRFLYKDQVVGLQVKRIMVVLVLSHPFSIIILTNHVLYDMRLVIMQGVALNMCWVLKNRVIISSFALLLYLQSEGAHKVIQVVLEVLKV